MAIGALTTLLTIGGFGVVLAGGLGIQATSDAADVVKEPDGAADGWLPPLEEAGAVPLPKADPGTGTVLLDSLPQSEVVRLGVRPAVPIDGSREIVVSLSCSGLRPESTYWVVIDTPGRSKRFVVHDATGCQVETETGLVAGAVEDEGEFLVGVHEVDREHTDELASFVASGTPFVGAWPGELLVETVYTRSAQG